MSTVFFIAAKLMGALLRPDTWIVIALAVIVLALILQRRRVALWVSGITLVVLVILSVLPIGNLFLQPIERSYPANPSVGRVDGIIVLGGGEDARASAYWDQMQFNEGAERYTTALALARRFPVAKVLFVGGSGELRDVAGATISKATIAERFLRSRALRQTDFCSKVNRVTPQRMPV